MPLENSLEGSVNATLDALAFETRTWRSSASSCHPIRHCLIARTHLELEDSHVYSHPQANGQCARFIRTRLPRADVDSVSSTADAVRIVAGLDERGGARHTLAAELYGCEILRAGVEDVAENETRFAWLAPRRRRPAGTARGRHRWSSGESAPRRPAGS